MSILFVYICVLFQGEPGPDGTVGFPGVRGPQVTKPFEAFYHVRNKMFGLHLQKQFLNKLLRNKFSFNCDQ